MKDLSFFLLKNFLGSKMKKGFKNFCNGDGSTSTLNQQSIHHAESSFAGTQSMLSSPYVECSKGSQPTLEEMILQLDLEEKMARRAKLDEGSQVQHRMSCVNSSDILRAARNALNQYPRFSLDGKDAMYRSSFQNYGFEPNCADSKKQSGIRKASGKDGGLASHELCKNRLPEKVAGVSVVWCKPGVVAKLMGLDAMPIPISSKEKFNSIMRKQNLRRRAERHEIERRKLTSNASAIRGGGANNLSCSSKTTVGYCPMKPIAVEMTKDEAGWPMRRFL